MTRRRFLVSTVLAAGPALAARHVLANDRRWFPADGAVRLQVVGENPGATLALEEMERTASLLGRSIVQTHEEDAVRIDLEHGSLTLDGDRFLVSASVEARAAALASWREPGAHAAVEWHHDLTKYGAEQLNQRFRRRFGQAMDAAAWMSWMLVKIAVDARLRSVSPARGRFDGHKGVALTFGPDRHLVQPLCIVTANGGLLGMSE